MDIFSNLKEISTAQLLVYCTEISRKISDTRDIKFNTMRQFEEIAEALNMMRGYFRIVCDELNKRTMTEEEMSEYRRLVMN